MLTIAGGIILAFAFLALAALMLLGIASRMLGTSSPTPPMLVKDAAYWENRKAEIGFDEVGIDESERRRRTIQYDLERWHRHA